MAFYNLSFYFSKNRKFVLAFVALCAFVLSFSFSSAASAGTGGAEDCKALVNVENPFNTMKASWVPCYNGMPASAPVIGDASSFERITTFKKTKTSVAPRATRPIKEYSAPLTGKAKISSITRRDNFVSTRYVYLRRSTPVATTEIYNHNRNSYSSVSSSSVAKGYVKLDYVKFADNYSARVKATIRTVIKRRTFSFIRTTISSAFIRITVNS